MMERENNEHDVEGQDEESIARQQHIRDLESRLKKLDRQFYALCLLVILFLAIGLLVLIILQSR